MYFVEQIFTMIKTLVLIIGSAQCEIFYFNRYILYATISYSLIRNQLIRLTISMIVKLY